MLYAAVAAICLSLIPATQVRADTDSFVYQFGGNTFTWELPSSPLITPDNASSGLSFTLPSVSVSENGGLALLGTMDFYSAANSSPGGLDFIVGSFYYFDVTGPQLYSAPETSPTFLPGTFTSLIDYGNGNVPLPGFGTLEISTKAVPEPSTFLLLIIGLGSGLAICFVRVLAPLRSVI